MHILGTLNIMELGGQFLIPIFGLIYQYKFEKALTFEKRFKPVLAATIVYTIMLSAFAFIYFSYINPHFASTFVMQNEQMIRQSAPTVKEFKRMVDFYVEHWQPLNQATSAAFGLFFVGLLSSLTFTAIASVVVTKK